MKKLILLAALVMSCAIFGQERYSDKKDKMAHLKDLSPEQVATLKTKKMTLSLDLSKGQYDNVYALHLDEAKTRKEQRAKREHDKSTEKPKLSSDEKFNKMNGRLDKKIAFKNSMKSILSEEQFIKWEDMQHRVSNRKRKHHKKNR
ncbi:MAG: hypothetical protein ACPG45_10390 [Flavobacteriaceae bacterium]